MFNRYSFRISKGFDLIILNSAVSHSPTLTLHFCISRQSQPGGFVEFLRCNSLEMFMSISRGQRQSTTVHVNTKPRNISWLVKLEIPCHVCPEKHIKKAKIWTTPTNSSRTETYQITLKWCKHNQIETGWNAVLHFFFMYFWWIHVFIQTMLHLVTFTNKNWKCVIWSKLKIHDQSWQRSLWVIVC